MQAIPFYLARLKHATPNEVWYRMQQTLLEWRIRVRLNRWETTPSSIHLDALMPDALQMPKIKGQANLNGYNDSFVLGTPYAKITAFECRYRNTFFGKIRISPDAPDIRAVWEPARLQHITKILTRALSHPEAPWEYGTKEIVKEQLLLWLEGNPFLKGPHYISSMECALRIPVFITCLKYLDNLSTSEFRRLANAVYSHAWWTSKRLSLYSSLGNHTIAESMGLIYGGAFFRYLPQGGKWLDTGTSLLRQELHHQILPDGGSAEQSITYHRFVLDLYGMCCDLLEINKLMDCTIIREYLYKGESFLQAFRVGDRWLSIGDSDDGHAVSRGLHPRRPTIQKNAADLEVFPNAGYTVLNTPNHCRMIFDHGPLGMPPLYNHGHADALSVLLIRDDQILLDDSGTYRYNGASTERAYFKGTRAHNTVCIDGLDQALQVTGFIWRKLYQINAVNQVRRDNGILLSASHNGYTRLRNPVRHTRRIYWDQTNFIIYDTFSGKGEHTFELNFHVHPHAELACEEGWWRVTREKATVRLKVLLGDAFRMIRGQITPLLGWHSPAYGEKEPCAVLQSQRQGHPETVRFVTVIATEGLPTGEDISRKVFEL